MDGRITDAVAALSLVAPDVLALRDVTLGRALGESPADRKSGITYCTTGKYSAGYHNLLIVHPKR